MKKNFRVATYCRRYDNKMVETREGWAKKGYVVKQRHAGEVMYTSGWQGQTARYFYETDVKQDPAKAEAYLASLRNERNRLRRKRYKQAKVQENEFKRIQEKKKQLLEEKKAKQFRIIYDADVLVFDTETTGLSPMENNILSLSWQLVRCTLLDGKWCAIEICRSNYFFDWPEDESRVTADAIEVNGLTKKRLAELGTVSRHFAIQEFAEALRNADFAVAHNADFDINFINSEARRCGIERLPWVYTYDTMKNMANYCRLEWYEGAKEYKWPRLYELAQCLDIDCSDIDFHLSAADVEVTKRCFVKMLDIFLGCPY